ncbi:hypothetical protein [Nocardiopsis sp. JB363]|uniref:hypothetical protein n=1 Tax=Nocardiopsis sp. JB363 TaxID=1434837 RepID=UPI000979C740|nr:hypothetical protein [Nocardiopsis sp. JB363]SIO86544.1 hypothetical protein BQ8420_12535 [Nocardiopsis sp. JB363]
MAARYLNPSELVYVRWRAAENTRWRRPRRAARVRAFAPQPPRPPLVPEPRRPVDTTDLDLLRRVLAGLHRLPEVA